jgi:ADP-heptose:LPS heptosyltransferase
LLTDFVETAAAILRLDGVITVDTAVAHLAGALGKDVWVLLSSPADWRWMRERTDSPWYPSVTLIRQTVPGDWSGPVREVASMVRKRIPGGARR